MVSRRAGMVCTSGRGARRASGASWCGSGCRTCSPTTPLSAATRGCVYILPIVHLMKLADSHLAMVSSIATVRFKIELQILVAQCTQRLLFCLHLPSFSSVRLLCVGSQVHVLVTSTTWKNGLLEHRWISTFQSKEEVLEVLLASIHIPWVMDARCGPRRITASTRADLSGLSESNRIRVSSSRSRILAPLLQAVRDAAWQAARGRGVVRVPRGHVPGP